MDKFRNLDSKGSSDAKSTATAVQSTHQNAISEVSIFKGTKSASQVLSTIGVDGIIVLWDLAVRPSL